MIPSIRIASRRAGALHAQFGLGLKNHAGHFLDPAPPATGVSINN